MGSYRTVTGCEVQNSDVVNNIVMVMDDASGGRDMSVGSSVKSMTV